MFTTLLLTAAVGLPAANPWVADSAYPLSHHDPAQTDSTPVDGPRIGRQLTVEEVQTVPVLWCSAPTFKHIGDDTVVFASTPLGLLKVRATGEDFSLVSNVPYPGREDVHAEGSDEAILEVTAGIDERRRKKQDLRLLLNAWWMYYKLNVNFRTMPSGAYAVIDREGYHYTNYDRHFLVKSFDGNKVDAACWAFIGERFSQFVYGFYPVEHRWRVNLSFVLLLVAIAPVIFERFRSKAWLYFLIAFPFIVGWLLRGGFGLEGVETSLFGGFMLTVIIGVTGITFSLPLGIALALGRTSDMPVVKMLCVIFIEFIRGVPLIALLFVASTMLNYFLPPGVSFDLLMRVLIMVTLFSAAYIAEAVRGGLQGVPRGQYEAADALGLSYWQAQGKIILPQALKISIPAIVNIFIGLYKDTTLVLIIGMLDPLGIGKAALSDATWSGLAAEVYLFVAIFFFLCCFGMSRYSLYLERKLHTGHER